MLSLLLSPGPGEIAIYGDGSFSGDLLVGAWAAHVPTFGLMIAGSDSGPSPGHFEFRALLDGIGAVVRVDQTTRPLHLHTDSEFVIGIIRRLSARADLPKRRSLESIRELYRQAAELIGTRSVRWSRADTKGTYHRFCHQSARRALREQIRDYLTLHAEAALRYEQRRRGEILRDRELLLGRLRRMDNRLRLCDARIAEHVKNI